MYVSKVIDFFKSYKIETAGLNTVYTLNNRYMQYIKPIDDVHYWAKLRSEEFDLTYDGLFKTMVSAYKKDKLDYKDVLYITRYILKRLSIKDVGYNDADKLAMRFYDRIKLTSKLKMKDLSKDFIKKELFNFIIHLNLHDLSNTEVFDTLYRKSTIALQDGIDIVDRVYISRYNK